MAITKIGSAGVTFPDSSIQNRRGAVYNQITSGTFTISSFGTWYNLFDPTTFLSEYAEFALNLEWAYNFSYYRGMQYFTTQGGFLQMPSRFFGSGWNAGDLGVIMDGLGSYGEYAALQLNISYPSSRIMRVYISAFGGQSGYFPNGGGTATWKLYKITY